MKSVFFFINGFEHYSELQLCNLIQKRSHSSQMHTRSNYDTQAFCLSPSTRDLHARRLFSDQHYPKCAFKGAWYNYFLKDQKRTSTKD